MYQSELMTELDRIIKLQLPSLAKQADVEGASPSKPCEAIPAKQHSYAVRSPSDVLIDLKDMLKAVILRREEPTVDCFRRLLSEIADVVNCRQVLC